MGNSYKRFYPVSFQLLKDVVVKLQTGFIRFRIITGREYSCPANGKPQTFEAHFGKQRNIFAITMIKVDSLSLQVKFRRRNHGTFENTVGHGICTRIAFAVFKNSTFALVCRNRPAPQKSDRKLHIHLFIVLSSSLLWES